MLVVQSSASDADKHNKTRGAITAQRTPRPADLYHILGTEAVHSLVLKGDVIACRRTKKWQNHSGR